MIEKLSTTNGREIYHGVMRSQKNRRKSHADVAESQIERTGDSRRLEK